MAYDYHGHWDKQTGHVAPMYHHPESIAPKFNAVSTMQWQKIFLHIKKFPLPQF